MAKLKLSLKARAIRYLSTREHSRAELMRKLTPHAQEGECVETLLNSLAQADWQSDARFTESLVRRRSSKMGNSRLFHELRLHGIDDDVVKSLTADLEESEVARAQGVWEKKFGVPPVDHHDRARQMRFLQQRGFSHATIQSVMRYVTSNRSSLF